jgi:hypothetical protein
MKIDLAIRDLADAETRLGDELAAVGERHKADHDVFHMTATLAGVERGHLDSLAPHAGRYGVELDGSAEAGNGRGPLDVVREKTSELAGRRPEPGVLLLRDLRKLYLLAAEASVDWVILGQGAQAVKDGDLLAVTAACHPQTLRTMKWATYRIKTAAPQTLAT